MLTNLFAQSPGAAGVFEEANQQLSAGNYEQAAQGFGSLLKDYPTDILVPSAQIQLAFSNYFLGKHDDALKVLDKALSGPALPEELAAVAKGLKPQILLGKAGTMDQGDAQKKTLELAVKGFDEYANEYPKADDLESILSSRVIAKYQLGNYDGAVEDCRLILRSFPNSSTLDSTKNLLAITLATQASIQLNEGKDNAAAFAKYGEAEKLLSEIIKDKSDLALYNDASFQLGEVLFNRAAFSGDDQKAELYDRALDAYRAVIPVQEIITLQEKLIASFPEKRREALQKRDEELLKRLEQDNLRALTKLEQLKSKEDPIARALQKSAEILFQKSEYNAARTLLRHVQPFIAGEEDQKKNLYFKVLTYALQNEEQKAVEGYTEFQSAHKGDKVAENLPLSMGNMFLNLGKPAEAMPYFDESLKLYPEGELSAVTVVSKAAAQSALGQQQEAIKSLRAFLATKPKPELAVIAKAALASNLKDTGEWEESIKAYSEVKSEFPGTPQALESDYWIAVANQQLNRHAEAITGFGAFVEQNPDHPLAPLALYAMGTSQLSTNQTEDGIVSLAKVVSDYPDSQPAPFTYFLRAQVSSAAGNPTETIRLMDEFITKYPQNENIFAAYETLALNEKNAGNIDSAIARFDEFARKFPDAPQAPLALREVAGMWRGKAEALGRFKALPPDEQEEWKKSVGQSVGVIEGLLKNYPDSDEVAPALQDLLANQRLLVAAGAKTNPAVEGYFKGLATAASTDAARSRTLFALADFVSSSSPERALQIMDEAYDPSLRYTYNDLDRYGSALVDTGEVDSAAEIFAKVLTDFPNPPGVAPTQAPAPIQEAQAIALFGQGKVAQARGETATAAGFFEQLRTLYPWSPKVLEAQVGIAEAMVEEGKMDEALGILGGVIRAPSATAELRAQSMLLFGDIMERKMKEAQNPEEKRQALDSAIDNFIKISHFYGSVPGPASEGLWRGAQLLELQASTSEDPEFKQQQSDRAISFYKQLVEEYPESEFARKAKEKLP